MTFQHTRRFAAALFLTSNAIALSAAESQVAPAAPVTQAAPAPKIPQVTQVPLTARDPSYFVVGHREGITSARFQFSFKYKLFDRDSVPTAWFPPLAGMHFAYTQTTIWDLSANSKPFRDTSYRPALFWDWAGEQKAGGGSVWSGQMGFEHESNGKQLGESRSINTAYVEPHWQTGLGKNGFLKLGARLITYIDRAENPEIDDYRGHATWLMSTGRPDGALYRLAWRQGSKVGRYSVQLDASYPLRRQYFANTGGYIYAQIFSGYGENLLDYNVKRPPQIRIGFAVTR